MQLKNILLSIILMTLIPASAVSQVNIGGIVNTYTAVTAFGLCANSITVADASGFSVGNTVIVIQMQGAVIDETNTAGFGTVSNYQSAGLWEKATIAAINSNEVSFSKNLLNTYQLSGKVQMVSLPVYSNAIVTSVLTGTAWNGSTGGIVALETSGSLTLNSNINAGGIGFNGGPNTQVCPNSCNFTTNETGYYFAAPTYRAAAKGQGVAAIITGKEWGRGAQANGGGGANDHNNGGAGGSNYAAGGTGGNNAEPGAFNCKGNNNGGRPGFAMNYSGLNRLFLGGGGGAGHGNNGNTGSCPGTGASGAGGNGGGIVIIIANSLINNGASINAAGNTGGSGTGDGAGGGGGGGAVFLSVNSFVNNLGIVVNGGTGGNTNNATSNRCYGPGGGGGAGIIISATALPGTVSSSMLGGAAGLITNSTNACNGSSSSAVSGSSTPAVLSGASVPAGTVDPLSGCSVVPVSFRYFKTSIKENTKVLLEWVTNFEQNTSHYIIERSTDAVVYSELASLVAAGNTQTETHYVYTDHNAATGKNYYRIKQVDRDGRFVYTNISVINISRNGYTMSVYPNPMKSGSLLTVEFSKPVKSCQYLLTDMQGRIIAAGRSVTHNQKAQLGIPKLTAGVYVLNLMINEEKYQQKLLLY
ncbi:MAG: T9SS type A sorting domain-containing protein [Ferruginibacter sp.]